MTDLNTVFRWPINSTKFRAHFRLMVPGTLHERTGVASHIIGRIVSGSGNTWVIHYISTRASEDSLKEVLYKDT